MIGTVEPATSAPQNIEKFLRRRFEIMPSDRWIAHYYYRQASRTAPISPLPKMRELRPPIETFPAYVGFSRKKGLSSLRDAFDAAMAGMRKDGGYDRILASWSEALVK